MWMGQWSQKSWSPNATTTKRERKFQQLQAYGNRVLWLLPGRYWTGTCRFWVYMKIQSWHWRTGNRCSFDWTIVRSRRQLEQKWKKKSHLNLIYSCWIRQELTMCVDPLTYTADPISKGTIARRCSWPLIAFLPKNNIHLWLYSLLEGMVF